MISIEQVSRYLPKFLSPESEKELFKELKQFPDNIDKRFYTISLKDEKTVYQGDGIKDLLVINLPDTKIKEASAVVLSNTCDIDINNGRFQKSRICYSPIVNLGKYRNALLRNKYKDSVSVDSHINSIRKQQITQLFYLPSFGNELEESFVFFDRICTLSNDSVDRNNLSNQRIFTLSNYGIWLFLLKLSIHFTRITDNVDRMSA
jgi:hypothetical protein